MTNGHLHQDDAARYAKTGWAPKFGQSDLTAEEAGQSLLDHQTFLEGKLDEKFFGGESCQLKDFTLRGSW